MLYLIATPLGNIKDITLRAIETLQGCDMILCEDTRHSKKLLNEYKIKTPLASYHKFNEKQKLESILQQLESGQNIALISDAGTPCIQDPGTRLVKACIEHNIPMTSLPGASALTTAMSLCGEEGPYQFIGFLPKKETEIKKFLGQHLSYEGQTFCFVSSHQLIKVLEIIQKLDKHRDLFLAKELTKIYETLFRGKPQDLLKNFELSPPKGEFVLMLKERTTEEDFSSLSIKDHVSQLEQKFHLSKNEAIKLAAKQRKVQKNIIYKEIHNS